uniref:19 kDa protein n=2 Tax=Grapevine leafroll-associated virus 2 TaxID=64003 RepID=Q2V8A1_9CLOS|nr:19 kDa protein [Grapevine leafroll-associated virus 2]QBZ78541.1 p19 [Grapevine leafroll-associated virus 2]QBZ78550.1 p19 [Grapevine leafroll-associated virus 2]QBZ78577.1 p19 [Grapevine leafroll-associated virus 2]
MEICTQNSESLVLLRTTQNTILLVIKSDGKVNLPKILICGYLRVSCHGDVTGCCREDIVKDFEGAHHTVIRSTTIQYDYESTAKEYNDSHCVVKFFLETGDVFWFFLRSDSRGRAARHLRTFFEANNFFFGSHCGTMEHCLKQVLIETESVIDSFCEERNR